VESDSVNSNNSFFNKGRIKFDRKLLVFLFFLFLSTIFWLLNELSKNSTTTIAYPVKYTNLPKDKVLVKELPSRFELTIEAPGYTLLKYKVSNRLLPLIFDLNQYGFTIMGGSSSQKFFILTSRVRTGIARQLRSDVQILNISPDSLIFEFGEIVQKRVPVVPDLSIELAKQYMVAGEITIDPDTIMVSGPDLIIDTIQQVFTRKEALTGVNQSTTHSINLEAIKNVTYSEKKVTITIPVEQFTEAVLDIPIEKVHVPDSLILKTFPGTVTLTCKVSLSNYEKLTPHHFRAVVDYEAIEKKLGNKLKVSIVKAPEYVRSIRFHPVNVEFIIEK
jgi:YbbR domain-containing protein